MRRIAHLLLILACLWTIVLPASVSADSTANLLVNPGFEEGEHKTEDMGTSLSSSVGNGWTPWSVLGDVTINREVEYKVLDVATLPDSYNIHSGNHCQKFFTTWGTHTAGFYQRVAVEPGSLVTFSIWVQIYTGERELYSNGHAISDLNWPTESNPDQGPGLYAVSAGIDPYGNTPVGFGAAPSSDTVWSASVDEWDTRWIAENGEQHDLWVQLTVSTIAQSDYVTVYTKGQPEYAVKHNDSFWDDASLVAETPPTATPTMTNTPTLTPIASNTPLPTETATSTLSPTATATLPATATATATATVVPPTATMEPPTATNVPSTETAVPSSTATATTTATTADEAEGNGIMLLYGGLIIIAVVLILSRFRTKR